MQYHLKDRKRTFIITKVSVYPVLLKSRLEVMRDNFCFIRRKPGKIKNQNKLQGYSPAEVGSLIQGIVTVFDISYVFHCTERRMEERERHRVRNQIMRQHSEGYRFAAWISKES